MPILPSNSPFNVAGRVARFRSERKRKAQRDAYVISVVEQVVDGIDPRLRGIARYAWKIRPAVERMLDYADVACSRLPGPVEFSSGAWSHDPCVHAVFATAKELQSVFSQASDIADFFNNPQSRMATHAYVVLGMEKTEKTTFGVAMEGEIVRKEVPQISVNFSGHRITHPAAAEDLLRRRLRERALNEFVGQALLSVREKSEHQHELKKRKIMLQVQLKALEREAAGLIGLLDDDLKLRGQIRETRASLAALERECSDMRESFGSLSDVLDQVVSLLAEPEKLIEVSPLTLCLDRMNRLIERPDLSRNHPITLAQVNFGKRFTRLAILAKFPRDDFLPGKLQVDLDAASRYLL